MKWTRDGLSFKVDEFDYEYHTINKSKSKYIRLLEKTKIVYQIIQIKILCYKVIL